MPWSTALLKIDLLAGSSIEGTATEMLRLARLLDVMIETNFNGIILLASANHTAEAICQQYWDGLKQEKEQEASKKLSRLKRKVGP